MAILIIIWHRIIFPFIQLCDKGATHVRAEALVDDVLDSVYLDNILLFANGDTASSSNFNCSKVYIIDTSLLLTNELIIIPGFKSILKLQKFAQVNTEKLSSFTLRKVVWVVQP